VVGELVGSYRLVERLGSGGMGVVWRAEHAALGRKAAIKMIRPELSGDAELTRRFFNEARSAAQIDHPGIVAVLDFGHHTDGSAFIVMELLSGEPLSARLARPGRLPLAETVGLARQIAATLAVVHAAGTVHRDLKPDNVFLVPDPDRPDGVRVKLLDFGVAKLQGSGQTRTGTLLGTPAYMAPEQCRGDREVDERADIYSLGCVLFEMACGRPPFSGDGFGAVLGAQMYEPPPRPRALDAQVAPALETLILAMLAKSAADRPQTMTAVLTALESIAPPTDGRPSDVGLLATLAAPTPPPAPARRFAWRAPVLLGAAVAIATGGVLLWRAHSAAVAVAPAPADATTFRAYADDGLRFRYPASATVKATHEAGYDSVNVEMAGSPLVIVQRFRLPGDPIHARDSIFEGLRRSFKAQPSYEDLGEQGAVRRIHGAVQTGRRFDYHFLGLDQHTEVYGLVDGGQTLVVVFQSSVDDEPQAAALFAAVADSLTAEASAR
jgi:hypothetical protein